MPKTQIKISYLVQMEGYGDLFTGFDAGIKALREYERMSGLYPDRKYEIIQRIEKTEITETEKPISPEELKKLISQH